MLVTHFGKSFASRWEIFCHSFMGMVVYNTDEATSATRCNDGMNREKKDEKMLITKSVFGWALYLQGISLLHFVASSDSFGLVYETASVCVCMRKAKFFSLLFGKPSNLSIKMPIHLAWIRFVMLNQYVRSCAISLCKKALLIVNIAIKFFSSLRSVIMNDQLKKKQF